MKKIWVLFFYFFCWQAGAVWLNPLGDRVNNGAGVSENNLAFVYRNFADYLDYALRFSKDSFSEKEINLIHSIKSSLPREYNFNAKLKFVFAREFPFNQGPGYGNRIAMTGSQVGSKIFINRSILYTMYQNNKFVSIEKAISIVAHELGHHHGEHTHESLDHFGAGLAGLLKTTKHVKHLMRDQKHIYTEYINLGENDFAQVLISDSRRTFDLTSFFKEGIQCPLFENQRQIAVGGEVYQSLWTQDFDQNWYLRLDLFSYCRSHRGNIHKYSDYRMNIFPTFYLKEGQVQVEDIKLEIKNCNERRRPRCSFR